MTHHQISQPAQLGFRLTLQADGHPDAVVVRRRDVAVVRELHDDPGAQTHVVHHRERVIERIPLGGLAAIAGFRVELQLLVQPLQSGPA
jgi:hypothetical protein